MRNTFRNGALAAIVGITVVTAQPAVAGSVAGNGGSTEITQLLNNGELAMQSIQEEMTYLQTQMNTYYNMLQQGSSQIQIFGMTPQQIADKYQSVSGVYNSVNRLYGSVQNMQQVAENRYKSWSATGLDWKSYVQREKDMAIARNDRLSFLTVQERSAIEDVKRNYEFVQQQQSALNSTLGTHQSMRVMNAQMNGLLGMVNQQIEQSAIQNQAATQEKWDALAVEQRNKQASSDFLDKRNKSFIEGARALESKYK